MKNILLLLVTVTLFASCSKEENTPEPMVETVEVDKCATLASCIIGTRSSDSMIYQGNMTSLLNQSTTFTYNSDGTRVQTISGTVVGPPATYSVAGNVLTITSLSTNVFIFNIVSDVLVIEDDLGGGFIQYFYYSRI